MEPNLAVIRIDGVKGLPAPLDVLKETEPVETMAVHVFGFPFGDSLALGRGSPSLVLGKGSVSSDAAGFLLGNAVRCGGVRNVRVDRGSRLKCSRNRSRPQCLHRQVQHRACPAGTGGSLVIRAKVVGDFEPGPTGVARVVIRASGDA